MSKLSKAGIKTEHALIQRKGKNQALIRLAGDRAMVIEKAQPIIKRNPGRKFRYIKLMIDTKRPWFKKGE